MKADAEMHEVPWLTMPKRVWRGAWLWTAEAPPHRNAYAYFRRPFETSGGSLSIDITADSIYLLYLDGKLVARGPARSDLAFYAFDTVSVEVGPGVHCLGIIVHHLGEINATVMTGRSGVLADVLLAEGGETRDFSTSAAWQASRAAAWRTEAPCTMSHFGFWEDCDLRLRSTEWMLAGFDGGEWEAAVEIAQAPCEPWPRLCPRDIPWPRYTTIEVTEWSGAGEWRAGEVDPVPSKCVAKRERVPQAELALLNRTTLPGNGGGRFLTADFGRTVSGYVEVDFADSEAGQCVELSYDDVVDAHGVVNPERSYAHLTDRYVLPGGPCRLRTLHARGFRYVMVDVSGDGDVELEGLTAEEETYPFELQPAFSSPDEALCSFYRKGAETVRICTTDAFTDCATRERVQWMEDLYQHSRVAAYAFGDTCMLRRALFQAAQGALPDGRINGFFPTERTNCAFAGSSIMWLHLLVDYWLFDGNEDIERLLPTARRLLDCFESMRDETGLIARWPAGQFWDWAPIEGSGCLMLTNAAYVWALERLAGHPRLGDALGRELLAQVESMRVAAHEHFWDAQRQLYCDAVPPEGQSPLFSQHANTMAVLAGICPAVDRQALLERLIDPQRLGAVPVGEQSLDKIQRPSPDEIVPVGTLWFAHFLCQALFENDMDELALEQMRTLWGAFDALPTFPETRIQHGNTFLCHGWAGGPAWLLPAYVLGVRPVARGWSEVMVQPYPGDLGEAAGTLATPHGALRIAWKRRDATCEIEIDAPDGVRIVGRG